MKTLLSVFSLLLVCVLGRAAAADPVQGQPLTPEQIEELVSPIALYPDPLIALILPASTFPSDVVLAARFLDRGGLPEAASAEPWDDSVRSLVRYREVIDYLDDHLEWTRRLGHCFLDQPDEVMDAIQMVRIRAKAAGFLADTPEQHVIVDADEICIVPAQPTIIYVPRYDPWVLCRPSFPYYPRGPFITFGVGCSVGSWLSFDCDWRSRSVRIFDRPAHWYRAPRWDDRDGYRRFAGTNWTRRSGYSHHDSRFDRVPRVAGYEVPGKDHRDWSERNRVDQHPNRDYRPNSHHYNGTPGTDRSRDWPDRRRPETDNGARISLNPAGDAVIPPVATPLPQTTPPVRSYRPPERPTRTYDDHSDPGDRPRGDYRHQPPARPTPPPAQVTTSRSRPVDRVTPPPPRRIETPVQTDQRSTRGDDGASGDTRPSSSGRDRGRVYPAR